MEIDICPLCEQPIMPAFKYEKWAWCDSCCAEITPLEDREDEGGKS